MPVWNTEDECVCDEVRWCPVHTEGKPDPDAPRPSYYRTVLTVEVLGLEPYTGGLEALSYAVTDGDYSGMVIAEETTAVDAERMSELLIAQGSDPEFLITEPE